MMVGLLVLLLAAYVIVGLSTVRYNSRTRVLLVALTATIPAWFYVLW